MTTSDISSPGLKYRIVKETIKHQKLVDFEVKEVETDRYVCQECVKYLEFLPGSIFPTMGGTDWKNMKYTDSDFVEKEAIFSYEQTARDFLDGKFGRLERKTIYEK